MPKVRYAEIIAVFREMEVPEKCPGCGAPLRNEENLKEPTVRRYDYVLYYTKGQLGKPEDEKVVNETGTPQFDHEDGLTIPAHDRVGELPSASADEDIPGFMFFCENCACDELLAGDPHSMVHRVENIVPIEDFIYDFISERGWDDYALKNLAHRFIDKLGLGEFYKGFLEEIVKEEEGE